MRSKPFFLTALLLSAALTATPTHAASPKFKVLYNFTGGSDGGNPIIFAALAIDKNSDLYGATYYGGTGCGGLGCGVVFEVTRGTDGKWSEGVVFDITDPEHQGSLDSPLAIDSQGNLYGCSAEAPTFELTPAFPQWNFIPIWQSPCGSGVGLTPDVAGDVYGFIGLGAYGEGAVSELSPGSNGWTLTELYSFCSKQGCPDGDSPEAPFSWDAKGNLYGTTYNGGYDWPKCYCGVAFQMTPNGDGTWTYHVMHRFSYGKDGAFPYGSLTVDAAGNAYGTTTHAGPYGNGNVFKLTPTSKGGWKLTVVYGFPDPKIGTVPCCDLVFDQAGNLYGVASGPNCGWYCGLVFKLAPQKNGKWKYSVLHEFDMTDGDFPNGLTMDSQGNLFGTTAVGGEYSWGVAFELTP